MGEETHDPVGTAARRGGRTSHVARLILTAFLFTFICARALILGIWLRVIPDLYVYARGTHVHHLNFGIVLLSLTGAWLLFRCPSGRELTVAALAYGIGLALTFDEFGMWLHLGGSYWQRASFDAVVVIVALLSLLAFAPAIGRLRPKHWITAVLAVIAVSLFIYGLIVSFRYAARRLGPATHHVEQTRPGDAR